jgi:hypothetical protein
MVDANGQPYENHPINNVAEKEDWGSKRKYEDAKVGAIANLSL